MVFLQPRRSYAVCGIIVVKGRSPHILVSSGTVKCIFVALSFKDLSNTEFAFLSSFTDQQTAFDTGLAYVTSNDTVIMKGDDTTWFAAGQVRPRSADPSVHSCSSELILIILPFSVRISSVTQYNTGLFILDLNHAPWGCGKLERMLELLFRHLLLNCRRVARILGASNYRHWS